jgi:DNA-directed RNA polymerase subunit omega
MDLKSLELAKRQVGGSFALSVLLQKRIIELVRGAPPVVERADKERSPIEVALREVLEGKISLETIPKEEFEKLVEQARLEKEGRAKAAADPADIDLGPRPAIPTIDLASKPTTST